MAGREDLLEILVGDLLEESDTEGARIFRVDGSTWVADGHFRIADFNDRFGVTLPEVGYETLSGLFLERLARIPQVGERLTFGDVTLQVVARDERRVKTLRIQTPPGPAGRRATGAGS
jgi:putative hemolysin